MNGDLPPTYPPVISQECYQSVQQAFESRRPGRKVRGRRPFLYRGLLVCRHCGCDLVGNGSPEGPYTYYQCTSGMAWNDPDWYQKHLGTKKCPQKIWKEREITAAVEKALADVRFDQDAFDELRRDVTGEVVDRHAAAEDDLKGLRKRRTELENEKEASLRAKLAGKIAPDELADYQRLRDKLNAELEVVNGQIQELEGLDDSFVDEGLATLKTAQDFLNLFQRNDLSRPVADTLADRKVLVKAYFKKIVVGDPLHPDPMYEYTWPPKYNGLEFHWNEPFSDLFEAGVINRVSAEAHKHPVEFPAVFSAKTKKWRA